MVLYKSEKKIVHTTFSELPSFLSPNDILVFNNTKVIKARLIAHRKTGGKVEIFLLKQHSEMIWDAMVSPQRHLSIGETLHIHSELDCVFLKKTEDTAFAQIEFKTTLPIFEAIERFGEVPLPPYISRKTDPNQFESQYQTVFAEKPGAVAAPTAGLHFTPPLLQQLSANGVTQEAVTLHVGYGTFKPIQTDLISDHIMHNESYELQPDVAERLTLYKNGQKRLVSVGTTVTRTLESNWTQRGFMPGTYSTQLFITPGYAFKAVDTLITNFHLPKSTLLVLVSTFGGSDFIRYAYQEAIRQHYRFYSFGDAMMILP